MLIVLTPPSYKPVDERKWGYYVCPILYKGNFVGRMEAEIQGETVVVKNVWREPKFVETWNETVSRKQIVHL